MATDYGSWTFAAEVSPPPTEPRSGGELNAFYIATKASQDIVMLMSHRDQTRSALLAIADFIKEPAFEFLRQRFIVLDERAMRRVADAIPSLLARARTAPDDMRIPFMSTYVDGTRHHSYEAGEVIAALDTAVIKRGDDAIFSEEAPFLWDVFTYLQSLQRLLRAALDDGRSVVFLRINELYDSFAPR